MKKIRIHFVGRAVGALGVMSAFVIEYEVQDWKEAIRRLYDKFEHIRISAMYENDIPLIPLPDPSEAWK